MLPSELARELSIDQASMSKILTRYYRELGQDRPPYLTAQTVDHLRAVHELVMSGRANNTPTAIKMVLGRYVAPILPESAARLHQSVEALDHRLATVIDMLERMQPAVLATDEYLQRVQARQALKAAQDTPSAGTQST